MAKYVVDTDSMTMKPWDGFTKEEWEPSTLATAFEGFEGAKEWDTFVTSIQEWYYGKMVKAAWCATSTSYMAYLCGKAIAEQVGKFENVDLMKEHFNKRKMLDCTKNYGGGSYKAKRGDVVFFSNKYIYADCTHVGVVQEIDHSTGFLKYISGNADDMIKSKTTNFITNKYVVAWGRVNY